MNSGEQSGGGESEARNEANARHIERVRSNSQWWDSFEEGWNKHKEWLELKPRSISVTNTGYSKDDIKELLGMLERLLEYKSHFRKSDIYKATDLINKYKQ